MQNLRLHFANRPSPDRPLTTGVHRIVREAAGTVGVGDSPQGALLAQICVDRRGLWLQVANGMRGVHINGRPVKRMAVLRPGDAVYVEGVELLLQSGYQSAADLRESDAGQGDVRVVLRGLGGKYHGKSISLEQPRVVGRARDAHIRVDDPAFAERHARLELRGERVLLRDLGSADGTRVNGVAVRDALLVAGDQIVFDAQHRFVLEVPWAPSAKSDEAVQQDETGPAPAAGDTAPASSSSVLRWPWLLLAALLMAGALSALLLFGAG
ncbi:FHA domain-containing protein [Pseudoxanthomonas sp. 3HH-4]|uniref:FHA domain-containing protein n=1 Tax=Pseudoxanthomonas sp. 3HH-4 TaxID=1690214 RepID=UPI00114EEA0B|nr:FHA domain-containing protein [Pseudoxanthomonas sp. 3HH-4]